MSTQSQLDQADLALQRADQELLDAKSALNRAQRLLDRALESGSGVDPGILREAQDRLAQSRARVDQAENAYTAAQQNYTQVFNAPDTESAENPQVDNRPPGPPPPPPPAPTVAAAGQSNPPDPNVPAVSGSAADFPIITAPAAQQVSGSAGDEIPLSSIRTQPDNSFVFDPNTGELVPFDSVVAEEIRIEQQRQDRIDATRAADIGGNFTEVYDVETGKFDVVNLDTGEVVDSGLSEQEAILRAQERSVGDPGYGLPPGTQGPAPRTQADIRAQDYADEQARAQALLEQARQQASISELRKANGTAVGDGDWRVRLRLAPNANYLYKTPGVGTAGIMEPLRTTDGVVFPYTPRIDMAYTADYNPYDLVHANYRGYFYKGSRVGEIILNATFTAQDSFEADYLLASIHFFRSCTKMFYGQDSQRGAPPPMVYLTGLGEFQFNEHPCVISQFNYNLPDDVDYIRSRGRQSTSAGVTQGGNGLMFRRSLSSTPTASYSLSSIWARLTGANIPTGAVNTPPPPPNLGLNSPTYVPTKLLVSLTLLPMPTRSQVSNQFSLQKYANGNLLKGGFW